MERLKSVLVAWVSAAVALTATWWLLALAAAACRAVSGLAAAGFSLIGAIIVIAVVYFTTKSIAHVVAAFVIAAVFVIGFALGGGVFTALAQVVSLAFTWLGIIILGALLAIAAWGNPDWYKA